MSIVLLLSHIGLLLLLLHSAEGIPGESIQSIWKRIEDLMAPCSPLEPESSIPAPLVPLNITRGPRAGVKTGPRSDANYEFRGSKCLKLHSKLGLLLAEMESKLTATKGAQQFLKRASRYGLPGTDQLRYFDNFVLSYDRRLKQPTWVLQHLTFEQMQSCSATRDNKYFQPDLNIHDYFRVDNGDYFGSGYTRGRYSPSCDNRASRDVLNQSFLMSNAAPLEINLAGSISVWPRLQRYIHFVAKRSKNIYIITGTLFMPTNGELTRRSRLTEPETVSYRVIGARRVAVPSHFYKVILSEDLTGLYSMEAFLIENSKRLPIAETLQRFRIDVRTQLPLIERSIGVKFFDLFDRNKIVRPKSMQYGFREQLNRRFDGRRTEPPPRPPRFANRKL